VLQALQACDSEAATRRHETRARRRAVAVGCHEPLARERSALAAWPTACSQSSQRRDERLTPMLLTIVVLLIVLWFLGYVQISNVVIPNVPLFMINEHLVTLVELLIFLAIVWAVSILPTPLRQIGFAVVVLWVLATLGIIAVAGLSSILVIAVIIGVIASLLGLLERGRYRRVT